MEGVVMLALSIQISITLPYTDQNFAHAGCVKSWQIKVRHKTVHVSNIHDQIILVSATINQSINQSINVSLSGLLLARTPMTEPVIMLPC